MGAFGFAFILWGGTILLSCALVAAGSFIFLDTIWLAAAIIGVVIAGIVTCPLLAPTTLLINLAGKIPYKDSIKLVWLGFALLVLNYVYFEVLCRMIPLEDLKGILFLISSISLVFMLIFQRYNLKQFFSEPTKNLHS